MNILDMKRKLLPLSGYMGGGGDSGGGGAQTTTSYNTNIPEYARPFVETMLGSAQQELFDYGPSDAVYEDVPIYGPATGYRGSVPGVQIGTERKLVSGSGEMVPKGLKPFKAFGGTYDERKTITTPEGEIPNPNYGKQTAYDPNAYFAGPTDLQTRARLAAQNMGVAPETNQAAGMANMAGLAALGTNYTPGKFSNQYKAPAQYNPTQLQNYQMQGPQDVRSQQFGQQAADQYMNPYMQSVVDIQQQDAQRQADIASAGRNAQATQTGAFGGSRQAIMDAEAAKNLASQKGTIQSQGLNTAYLNAQQQFNADQAQRMQAALANQGMGYNVGSQNLQANLGVQQAREQASQYGYGQQMTAAQQLAQYGLAAQQAAEQSRQFGASLGMQGLQTGLQASNQLGTLGQNIYGQRVGNINLQNQMGAQQQQEQQAILNQQIQDYATARQYPMMQLSNMSNLLRGMPMQSTTVQGYQAQPNALSQLGGIGLTGAAIAGLGKGNAKGGRIKEKQRPAGLAELALSRMV